MHAQTITTNRKQHKKGGVSSYGLFRNEVTRTLAQGNVVVTTMIDFFKLPTDFPGFTSDSSKVSSIEDSVFAELGNDPNFLPYIQRHEVESLMYSSMDGFNLVVDDPRKQQAIQGIINEFDNPEDINNSPETAPSKRLKKIFNYDKTQDGEMILEMVGIDVIIEKCPRFKEWILKIEAALS